MQECFLDCAPETNYGVLAVYEMIPETGKILTECLQEIPTIDAAYFDRSLPIWKQTMVGLAMNGPAELIATAKGVWVSNRGEVLLSNTFGTAENSVRFLEYQNDGARLAVSQTCLNTQGPVRHFLHQIQDGRTTILSGMNRKDPGLLEIFSNASSQRTVSDATTVSSATTEFQKVGEFATGIDVLCLVAMSEKNPQG